MLHRFWKRGVIYEHDVIDVGLMMVKWSSTDFDRLQTIGKTAGCIESYRHAFLPRAIKFRRADRLDANNAYPGNHQLHSGCDARTQSAAANWNEHRLYI